MKTELRTYQNVYLDSVALMRISANIAAMGGIEQASALMATPANLDLLVESGLLSAAPAARPSDLVVVIKGEESALEAAFTAAAAALAPKESKGGEAATLPEPSSLLGALTENPEASLALISTPGAFAGAEALKALGAGLNVMLFSDNVPAQQEARLKRFAAQRGLLVMGPDCGTSIINGAPLAFANVVRRGGVGVVGASGTGIQQVTCLVDQLGEGISHAIGTGGHDLSVEIGGLTMLAGIRALAEDPATRVIALISKPPAREVADKVLETARASGKPVVVNFLGMDWSAGLPGANLHPAATLEECAQRAVALLRGQKPDFNSATPQSPELMARAATLARPAAGQKYLRGLYTGGTFCYEAQLILRAYLQELSSNGPVNGVKSLSSPFSSVGHTVVDLGDDVFTRGKPHPMIDPAPRHERLLQEAADPECAVILLDVVLGYGSHEDPAGELASAVFEARKRHEPAPLFVASICGTDADPQNYAAQRAKLEDAGVQLCSSNAEAVVLALLALLPQGQR